LEEWHNGRIFAAGVSAAWTIIRAEKRFHPKFLLFVDRLSLCCARKRAVGWLATGDFLAGTRLN
jgi:hypothetical protein